MVKRNLVCILCLCTLAAVRLQSPKDERPRTVLRPKSPILNAIKRVAPRFVVPPPPYSVRLTWKPGPVTPTNEQATGFYVWYGPASIMNSAYTNKVNVGNVTNAIISQLYGLSNSAVTYFFSVTAYGTNGFESDFSNEVSVKKLDSIVTVSAGTNSLTLTNPPAISQFWRLRGVSWTGADLLTASNPKGPWTVVQRWQYVSNAVPRLSIGHRYE